MKDGNPNFIFILTDDLGWGDLGCYGHPDIKTPNIDRIAQKGTLFTQFYVNSTVCSPSRASFMTGRFPARDSIHTYLSRPQNNRARGVPDWLDPSITTITRLLKQAGYITAHFGKWHLATTRGVREAPSPAHYGVDHYRTTNPPFASDSRPTWDEEKIGPYFRAESTRMIVDETIRFIETNKNSSFYINVWTLLPHGILHPTEEQMKPYTQFDPKPALPYKGAMQIYYSSVTEIDNQIGRLMEKLDELDLTDNTMVLFSSDNGPADIHIRTVSHSGVGSPGPFRGRKCSLYEGGIRMPLIVSWPARIPFNRVDDTSVVSGVDFLPTLCRIAGVDPPNSSTIDGENVAQAFLGHDWRRSKPLMWEWRYPIWGHLIHKSPMLAIREGRWKLLANPDRSRLEMYDIPNDPSELNNVADSNPRIVQRLLDRLLAWQKTLPKGPISPYAGSSNYPWPGRKRKKAPVYLLHPHPSMKMPW